MMQNLSIVGNDVMPSVEFNYETGVLRIEGRSLLEDAVGFYQPLLLWIDKYLKDPKQKTTIIINLEYFNSASARMIAKILMKLEEAYEKDLTEVRVIWKYIENDDIMLEKGKEFKSIVFLPFEFEVIR